MEFGSITIGLVNFPLFGSDESMQSMSSTLVPTFLSTQLLNNLNVHTTLSPISTSIFPDRERTKRIKGVRRGMRNVYYKRLWTRTKECCICLEPIRRIHICQLPCGHTMHRLCVCSLLNSLVHGSQSMLRCPLCRYELDRFSLQSMGFAMGPARIAAASRRCHALRSLGGGMFSGDPTLETTARMVQRCHGMVAPDGLIFNVCALSIERALQHRLAFGGILKTELKLAVRINSNIDVVDFISRKLACHIDVLMHTGNVIE